MKKKSRILKRTLITISSLLIIIAVALAFIGDYFYKAAISRESEKDVLKRNPDLTESEGETISDAEKLERDRILGVDEFDWEIKSFDNLALKAKVYARKEYSDKWAVIVHGYSGNAAQMGHYVEQYSLEGYNVVTPDCRGHGKSKGHYIGMGWDDRHDIRMWIDKIIKRDSNAKIALMGVSMGASAVLSVSGEKLPENVKCIISDCAFTSARDIFAYNLKKDYNLPEFPFIQAADFVSRIRAGYSFSDASAISQVKKSQTPTLFIHGGEDSFVPLYMQKELFEACSAEKDILVVPGAIHGSAAKIDPEGYWNKIWTFSEKFL